MDDPNSMKVMSYNHQPPLKSVIIFVVLQMIGLVLVMIFPQLALMLPDIVMGAAG